MLGSSHSVSEQSLRTLNTTKVRTVTKSEQIMIKTVTMEELGEIMAKAVAMKKEYKTADLFAGIGGIRLGFELTGRTQNVFSSEIDKYACQTYVENFGESPYYDITAMDNQKSLSGIPAFDILLAGFPCQPFSIAGKGDGFKDDRGNAFFYIERILREKKPEAFLLENVKGLLTNNRGKTFTTIIDILEKKLGYTVFYRLLNSKDFNVPQKRERLYIVGFKSNVNFRFPVKKSLNKRIKNILEKKEVSNKYYLSRQYLTTLKKHRARHKEKGHGFGFKILGENDIANTLVVGGMGSERNLIHDRKLTDFLPKTRKKGGINKEFVRKLTPREWARLQGFPEDFKIPVSDTQAYKQFGNSVSVPVIYEIAKEMVILLDSLGNKHI